MGPLIPWEIHLSHYSNAINCPMGLWWDHRRSHRMSMPKLKKLWNLKLTQLGTLPCSWILGLAHCVCSHMSGTPNIGGLCPPHPPNAITNTWIRLVWVYRWDTHVSIGGTDGRLMESQGPMGRDGQFLAFLDIYATWFLLAIHNFYCYGLQAGALFHKCPLMYAYEKCKSHSTHFLDNDRKK